VTTSTGKTINVLTSKVPLRDENGSIIGVLGSYLDISAYKRTEEALRTSEQHLRKSQEVAHLGSWELDVTRNQLTWSDETYRIFGLQPQEFGATFEAFLSFVHPDDRGAVEAAYHDSIAEGRDSYEIEHRIVLPGTGQVRVVHEKCDHVRDPAGGIIRSIGVVQDITERRKADEDLRQSEERFRTLVDLSPVAMLVSIGVEEKVEFINRRFTELFGYTVKDIPDVAHWWPLAYPDERYRQEVGALWTQRVEEAVRNHAETGPVETEVTCRDGTRRFVEFRLVSIGSKNLVFATDLTGHKAAMDEIRSSKAFLDNVIDMSPFSMWISDREGTIIRVNRSLCDAIRLHPEDIVGKYNVFHDDNLKKEGVMPKVKEVFENRNATRFSIPWRAADAGTSGFVRARDMYIDVSMFPIADVQGRLANVVCQWVDITERRRAEEALRQSEHRVQTLLTAIPDMMFIITRDGTYRDYRMPEGAVPAVPPDQIVGTNVRDSGFSAATTAAILNNIANALDTREIQVFDYQLELPQGPRQYEARLVALGHDEVLGIVRDITERKKAEHERETLIRDLEQKNAELERFTYTVSHDLKSPLITIKGFAGMLEDDAQKRDAVQLKKDVRRITDAAETMQQLLTDVLELSRIGRIVSPPETAEFGDIAREAAGLLAGPIAERGVTVEIAPGLPAVNVDRARIREVMVNLIENSIKYMGSQLKPVIRIGVEYDRGAPVFFVQDNGIGIERRYIDRIFNLFEKLDPSTPGTGVGLTIVKRIIEVHGGKVWADSEGAGKGTTIRFTLPGPEEPGGR
jgi:PAS domain S-box-containing protein